MRVSIYLPAVVVAIWLFAGQGAVGDPPPLATLSRIITKDGSGYVGEIINETPTTLTLTELGSGRDQKVDVSNIKRIERNISDDSAVVSTDLPTVLAWKIKRLQRDWQQPIVGKIARVTTAGVIYTTIGSDQHAKVGDHLTVFRNEGELKDPDTGKVLGSERTRVGEIEIVEVDPHYCKGKLLGDLELKLAVDDEVQTASLDLDVAVFPPLDPAGKHTDSGDALTEQLTTTLVDDKVSVVERSRLDASIAELSIQTTDLFDPKNAQKFGKQLGATVILTGKIVARDGRTSEAHMRLIDVQSGEILLAASSPLKGAVGDTADNAMDGGEKTGDKRVRSNMLGIWRVDGHWDYAITAAEVSHDTVHGGVPTVKGNVMTVKWPNGYTDKFTFTGEKCVLESWPPGASLDEAAPAIYHGLKEKN